MRGKRSTSREEIFSKVKELPSAPIAFEALWDGDSYGWHIYLYAITGDAQSHYLGLLCGGGDLRLFNGLVPPWPEALAAEQLGNELASQYDAEFYFPSPNHPEDDCPRWQDRDKAHPCRHCGIPLLQREDCPWHGLCFQCHLNEERERKEARWTPEQRNGARCHICGNPATTKLNGGHACATCFDKYEVYRCEKCNGVRMLPKSKQHTSLCSRCETQKDVDSLAPAQRDAIRDAMAKGDIVGLKAAMDIMGCSLNEAERVLLVLDTLDHANEERN